MKKVICIIIGIITLLIAMGCSSKNTALVRAVTPSQSAEVPIFTLLENTFVSGSLEHTLVDKVNEAIQALNEHNSKKFSSLFEKSIFDPENCYHFLTQTIPFKPFKVTNPRIDKRSEYEAVVTISQESLNGGQDSSYIFDKTNDWKLVAID